jgi:adenylyl-sulfate kinase
MEGQVAWFTGLSGAGKSSIAQQAAEILEADGRKVLVLDGDVVRSTVTRHLGFSREDIHENNRKFIDLCRESVLCYDFVLVPKISPIRQQRAEARRELGTAFVEVYVHASLEEVAKRDPKGLYRRAKEGDLPSLIGVAPQVPYEPPEVAEVVLHTEKFTVDACGRQLTDYLLARERPD